METRIPLKETMLARVWLVLFTEHDLTDFFDLKAPIEMHGLHHSGRTVACRLLAHAIGNSMLKNVKHDPSIAIPTGFGIPVYFDDELTNLGLHHALRKCKIDGVQVSAMISNAREYNTPSYQNLLDRLELGCSGVIAASIALRSDFNNIINDMKKACDDQLPPTVIAMHRRLPDEGLLGEGKHNNVYVQVFNDPEEDLDVLGMAFRSVTGEVCVAMYEIVRTSEYATFNTLSKFNQNRILVNHKIERHSIPNRRLDVFIGYINKLLGE